MCGIVGYVGGQQAYPIIVKGLHRLEYRGYDSAGIAISTENCLNIYKQAGKVSELEDFTKDKEVLILALSTAQTRGVRPIPSVISKDKPVFKIHFIFE